MKCGVCMGLRSIPPRFDCMLLVDHLCCQIHEELPNCSRIIKTEHLCMRLGHCMELDMMLKDSIISITLPCSPLKWCHEVSLQVVQPWAEPSFTGTYLAKSDIVCESSHKR